MNLAEILARRAGPTVVDPVDLPKDGMVFCFSDWSSESIMRLRLLIDRLNKEPDIPLYVYDIDKENYKRFAGHYDTLSQGKGEIYKLGGGKLILEIKDLESI